MMKKKLIAYLGSGSLTPEDARMLTHVNIAFGKLLEAIAGLEKLEPGAEICSVPCPDTVQLLHIGLRQQGLHGQDG